MVYPSSYNMDANLLVIPPPGVNGISTPSSVEISGATSVTPPFTSVNFPWSSISDMNINAPNYGGYYSGGDYSSTLVFNSSMVGSSIALTSAFFNETAGLTSSVSFISEPLPYRKQNIVEVSQLVLPMLVAMGFLPLAYIALSAIIAKSRNLTTQFHLVGYTLRQTWLLLSLFKLLTSWLPLAIVSTIVAFALNSPIVGDDGRWLGWLLLIITYAYCVLPFGLMIVPLFKDEKTAVDVFPLLWNVITIVPYIIVFILSSSASSDTRHVGDILGDVFTIIPTLSFQRGLQQLLRLEHEVDRTWQSVWRINKSGILLPILVNIVMGSIFWHVIWIQTSLNKDIFTYKIYLYIKGKIKRKKQSTCSIDPENLDDHNELILEEINRVEEVSKNPQNSIIINDLYVKYLNALSPSVNHLSICAENNQFTTLLGPNGAGKTTTMKALCNLLYKEDLSQFSVKFLNCNHLSYCPQYDALWPNLTAREHLFLLCKIAQYDDDIKIHKFVNFIIESLDINDKVYAGELSGGHKRKLSFAIALVISPISLILDEPTTGVDPDSRRKMWKIFSPQISTESSILLSTHVMEEAEALSNKIIMMSKGELKTAGSISLLKGKYCSSVICFVNTIHHSSDFGENFINNIDNSRIVENVLDTKYIIEVDIVNSNEMIIDVMIKCFEYLEEEKEKGIVLFYSVSQTSLEQIFLRLCGQSE